MTPLDGAEAAAAGFAEERVFFVEEDMEWESGERRREKERELQCTQATGNIVSFYVACK